MAESEFLTATLRLKDEASKQLQTAGANLSNFANSFKQGMAQSGQAFSSLAATIGKGVGMIVSPLGLAAAAATGFGAVLRKGVIEAAEFEEAMAHVALQSKEAADSIGFLSQAVEDMAPRVARDEVELAKGMEAIADAGVNGSDAINLLSRASALATTTHTDFAQTIDLVTKSMVALGVESGQATDYTNKLYKMSIAGVGNFSEMATVTEFLAGTFRTARLSTDELLASVAHLSTIFPRSREAVMAMRSAIESIRKPSEDAKLMAKELGIDFSLAALQAKGLSGFFAELADKTKGDVAALDTLLGSMGAWKLAVSMAGKDGEAYRKILKDIGDQEDILRGANERMLSTTENRWKTFTLNLKGMAHDLGKFFTPWINDMTDRLNKFMEKYLQASKLMSPEGQGINFARVPADWWKGRKPQTLAEQRQKEGPESFFTGHIPTVEEIKARNEAAKKAVEDAAREMAEVKKRISERMQEQLAADDQAEIESIKAAGENQISYTDYLYEELTKKLEQFNEDQKALQEEANETWQQEQETRREREKQAAEEEWADGLRRLQNIMEMRERAAAAFAGVFGDRLISGEAEVRMGQWLDALRENMAIAYETVRSTAQNMEGAFSEFFFDAMTGKLKTFSDYIGSFLQSMAKDISETLARAVTQGIANILSQIVSGKAGFDWMGLIQAIVGAFAGSKAPATGATGGGYSFHSGGRIPRMHWGGLRQDEGLFIGQAGERVLSRTQNRDYEAGMRAAGNGGGSQPIIVNINAIDSKSLIETMRRSPNAIMGPIIENLNRSGSLRGAIQGAL